MAGLSQFQSKLPGWFKLNAGDSKEVFIPLELTEMTRAVVHTSPKDYRKNAICTFDSEELCYACQQGTFQWNAKVKIYIPVIEKGKLNIMVQGTGVNSAFWPLAKRFQQTGTSVGWYTLSRNGLGKRSKYSAEAIDKLPPTRYTRIVDLKNHISKIDYSLQEKYYS